MQGRADEIRQLVHVVNRYGPIADSRVDLFSQFTHGLGILEKVVHDECKHACVIELSEWFWSAHRVHA